MDIKKLFEKENWKKDPCFSAAISAALYGILVHSFAFFNILHNHDNIASQPGGYGMGVSLGRWFLEILGQFLEKIGLNYNLSSVNGFLYICVLAVTAGFLVSTLGIKSRRSAALIGALLVSFPSATATMIYRFTVVFYGISLLLAVLAVWVLQRSRRAFPLSALLIALSMGIYQANIPLTIALFVLLLIQQGLTNKADARELVLQGLFDCAVLIVGLLLYFAGVMAGTMIMDVSLVEYQGVSSMGNLSLNQLPELVWRALYTVCMLPVQDYCGIANRALMRIAYLLLAVCCILMIGYILVKKVKKPVTSVIICLLCVAFLIAVGFIQVMVPDGWIYTLMVYPFCMLACAPLVILECLPVKKEKQKCQKHLPKQAVSLLVAVLVVFYGYYANVNYTAVYYAGEQISNYFSNVVVRAAMTEGYTPDMKWAFIGEIDDPLLESTWQDEISYTGLGFTEYLMNQYSRYKWIENYVGYSLPMADEQALEQLKLSEEVESMPCYPSAGSIQILEDTVVIKFQNTAE